MEIHYYSSDSSFEGGYSLDDPFFSTNYVGLNFYIPKGINVTNVLDKGRKWNALIYNTNTIPKWRQLMHKTRKLQYIEHWDCEFLLENSLADIEKIIKYIVGKYF